MALVPGPDELLVWAIDPAAGKATWGMMPLARLDSDLADLAEARRRPGSAMARLTDAEVRGAMWRILGEAIAERRTDNALALALHLAVSDPDRGGQIKAEIGQGGRVLIVGTDRRTRVMRVEATDEDEPVRRGVMQ